MKKFKLETLRRLNDPDSRVAELEVAKIPEVPHKSAHKKGEHFDDDWDYASRLDHPKKGETYELGDVPIEASVTHSADESYCEILIPRPKPVRTTVTVWETDKAKYEYHFKGLPDIDRIIRETLEEQGALAIKVECNKEFIFDGLSCESCYIWLEKIGSVKPSWWKYKKFYAAYGNKDITSTDIEAAIKTYLNGQKKDAIPYHKGQTVIVTTLDNIEAIYLEPCLQSDNLHWVEWGNVRHQVSNNEICPVASLDGQKKKPKLHGWAKVKCIEQEKEPEFKIDDIVVLEPGGVVRILACDGEYIRVLCRDGKFLFITDHSYRHATPAETAEWFTRTYGSVRMRAFRSNANVHLLMTNSKSGGQTCHSSFQEEGEALCAALNPPLPISDDKLVYPTKGE